MRTERDSMREAEVTMPATWTLTRRQLARWVAAGTIGAVPAAQAQLLPTLPNARSATQTQVAAVPGSLAAVQVTGSPTTATVTWTLHPAALDGGARAAQPALTATLAAKRATLAAAPTPAVTVERVTTGAAPVRLATDAAGAARALDAGPLRPGVAVTYRVTVTDSRGAPSVMSASYTPPLPRDPSGLSAAVEADGSVTLRWQAVDGADGYQISGTTLAAPVSVRHATEWRSAPQKPGPVQWKVASSYAPAGVLTPASAWPAAITRTVPRPQALFLSQPPGGGTSVAEAHLRSHCVSPFASLADCPLEAFIGSGTNWADAWARESITERDPKDYRAVVPNWSVATFVDTLDLGVGRRVNCAPPRAGKTVCWASSHFDRLWGRSIDYNGASAGGTRTADWSRVPPVGALHDDAQRFANTLSVSVIVMQGNQAFFGVWTGRSNTEGWSALDREHAFVTAPAQLQTAAVLDSQGRKEVPHVCMSCHGGRYDAASRLVVGASLLPLIPSRLQRFDAQAIRRINDIVLASNPAPAIANQIRQWNASNGEVPVPPGWAQQAGLYRQVIEPYCVSCHFAQQGPLSFESYGQMASLRASVQRAVCSTFSMPHSEILFKKFWSEGGFVSLPGLLSSALGYAKCPE